MRSTGISAVAYGKLKRHMGLDGEPPDVYDVGQMLAEIEEPVRQRFGFDIVPLEPWRSTWRSRSAGGSWTPRRFWDGQDLAFPSDLPPGGRSGRGLVPHRRDGQRTRRMPPGGLLLRRAAKQAASARPTTCRCPRSTRSAGSGPFRMRIWTGCACVQDGFMRSTPYAMLGRGLRPRLLGRLRRYPRGDWMCLLAAEPGPTAATACCMAAEAQVERFRLLEQAVGRYVSAWMVAADDMGTQKGEQFRMETFTEVIQPAYAHVCGSDARPLPDEELLAFMRLALQLGPRPDRRRAGLPQSSPDVGRQHGPLPSEGGVRGADRLLGRRL